MPTEKVPIRGYPYQNIDGVELNQQPERLVDGYVDEAGAFIRRPGLAEFSDLETGPEITGITGMYYWVEKDVVVAISNQNAYKVTVAGVKTDITNDQLTGVNRTTFAEVTDDDGSHHLAMADGGNIVSWDGAAGQTTQIADPDAPTNVTHVAELNGYLLANNGDNKFYWADLNDFDDWSALSFASAETNNDDIDAVLVPRGTREIHLMGRRSVEVWGPTEGAEVFIRKQAVQIADGLLAVYSLQEIGGGIPIYLNKDRRIVTLIGRRSPKVVSTPFDKVFANLTTVADAFGDVLQVDGRGFYVLTFPTEDRTFVYDFQKDGWAEWAYWHTPTAAYQRYRGAYALYVPEWGKHLVGDRSNGKIYTTTASDFDDDGDTLRLLLKSGHVNHGSNRRKRTNRLILKFKRGVATSGETTPQISIRWRQDGGAWGNATLQSLGLGQTGENEFFVYLHRLGIYRTRQYEIVHADATEFIFVEAEEDFDWLTS